MEIRCSKQCYSALLLVIPHPPTPHGSLSIIWGGGGDIEITASVFPAVDLSVCADT